MLNGADGDLRFAQCAIAFAESGLQAGELGFKPGAGLFQSARRRGLRFLAARLKLSDPLAQLGNFDSSLFKLDSGCRPRLSFYELSAQLFELRMEIFLQRPRHQLLALKVALIVFQLAA